MLQSQRVSGLNAQESSVRAQINKSPRTLSPRNRYSFGGAPLRGGLCRETTIQPMPIAGTIRMMPGGVPPTSAQAVARDMTISQMGALRSLGEPLSKTWAPFDREVDSSKKALLASRLQAERLGNTLAAIRRPDADVRQNPLMLDRDDYLQNTLKRSGTVSVGRSIEMTPADRLRMKGVAVAPGGFVKRPTRVSVPRRSPEREGFLGHPGLATGPTAGWGTEGGSRDLGTDPADSVQRGAEIVAQGIGAAVVVAGVLTLAAVGGLYYLSTRE
jgi:hypothetical protein